MNSLTQLRYQDFSYIVQYKRDGETFLSEMFTHPTDACISHSQAQEYAEELSLDMQNEDVIVLRCRNRNRDGEIKTAGW